ncbi:hypothetical protein [Sanguibacter suaedae]|uniref:Uncharacterized protein n=1 Tax=Sanguibacter suaedae TaxID=2795737 RepID=A0A934I5D6_9MICO|nr:hypothetical protein [Sanguibacter suaedae]MBI9113492.1 hypothetical protein [Sanguibacter suaedae]
MPTTDAPEDQPPAGRPTPRRPTRRWAWMLFGVEVVLVVVLVVVQGLPSV